MDNDLDGLEMCIRGMQLTSERMRKATLGYLIDRFILQPKRDHIKAEIAAAQISESSQTETNRQSDAT